MRRVIGIFPRGQRPAAPVGPTLAMQCPSQRHRSRETAIERSTETARQRQLRALLVSLLEPIFEEDAVEARPTPARPFLCDSFIHDSTPVYPGAPVAVPFSSSV